MIWLLGTALAATPVEVTLLAGGRTAPESALQIPSEWENELEPSALAAVEVDLRHDWQSGAWVRLQSEAWGYLEESEASLADITPRAGWSSELSDTTDLDLAARYDRQWVAGMVEASHGRAEAIARLSPGRSTFELRGVDRHHPQQQTWSLRVVEAEAATQPLSDGGPLTIAAGGQINEGWTVGGIGVWGGQARARLGLDLSGKRWNARLGYRFIYAAEGEFEEDVRPVFTPIGDYSDDVDALSGGGFLQNRFDVDAATVLGKWTLAAGALVRFRGGEDEHLQAAYARTLHGHLKVSRPAGDAWRPFVSVGANSATLGSGQGYTDVYGWAGVEWRPAR